MSTYIEVILTFKGKDGNLEYSGDYMFSDYPYDGLYRERKLGKFIGDAKTVDAVIKKFEDTYIDTPEIKLFADISNSTDILDFDTIEVVEIINGDFSYFELEALAEDLGFDPNWSIRAEYEYDIKANKDKAVKIVVVDDNDEDIDITKRI